MVDLHQVEPGLPDGHPWKTCSRWQMAWRTFLATSLVAMVGILLFSAIMAKDGAFNLIQSHLPYMFSIAFPLVFAGAAAIFGQWLRRYYPFSQSLLFGGIGVTMVMALSAIISLWDWIAQGPCPPDTYCSAPFDGMMWAVFLFGLPAALSPCIGYGLAIWSPTRRGVKVFWPLFAGVLAFFVTTLVVVNL